MELVLVMKCTSGRALFFHLNEQIGKGLTVFNRAEHKAPLSSTGLAVLAWIQLFLMALQKCSHGVTVALTYTAKDQLLNVAFEVVCVLGSLLGIFMLIYLWKQEWFRFCSVSTAMQIDILLSRSDQGTN